MRVTFRPARREDLAIVAEPLPHRIRAIAATVPDDKDGERVIGIGGLGFRPDGTVIAFAHLTDEMKRYPRAVHRAGRAGMAMFRASKIPTVIAQAQPDNPAAEQWLRHFGFRPLKLKHEVVFVWRRDAR